MNEEIIAKLVGVLKFNIDASNLVRFNKQLDAVQRRMTAMGQHAEKLQKQLNMKMGIKGAGDRSKLDAEVRRSLDRELKMETRIAQYRRNVFSQELAGQKLKFANSKEHAFLQTASLKRQQEAATLQAKQQRAETVRLQAQGQALKNEGTIAANKAKAVRAEQILAQQQARTIALQQKAQAGLTQMQKLEQSLSEARTRAHRAAESHVQRMAAAKVRAARQDTAHEQRAERFQWATQRQAQWEANRNKPDASTGFMGLGTGALAVGGAAAGLAAVVAAINALGDRLDATQSRVSESQQFTNTLQQAGGANPANQQFAKDEFLRITQKYGVTADLESAKAYRTFVMAETARGNSLSQATSTYETRSAAYRGAGMTREEQQRANLQLQQINGKSQADREDLNTFTESAPLLIEPIRRAWAARNKHALDGNLEKDFRASTTAGNLKAVDFTKGIELFVKENADAIARQSESVDANATRLDNAKYIQQQSIDQNPDLINAVNDRIKAETELTAALEPLKIAAAATDAALMKLAASFLRWVIGKDATPADAANKIETLSPDKPAIDINGFGASTGAPEGTPRTADPVDRLYRYLFGKEAPAKSQGDDKSLGNIPDVPLFPGMQTPLNTGSLDKYSRPNWGVLSNLPVFNPANMMNMENVMNSSVTSGEILDSTRRRVNQVGPDGSPAAPAAVNTNSNNTTNIDVAPTNVNITVTAAPGMDAEQVANLVDEKFRNDLRPGVARIFSEYLPKEVH